MSKEIGSKLKHLRKSRKLTWKETFEYMYENNQDFFCDNVWADGTKNNDWTYALHLDDNGGSYYLCVIERA